MRGDVVYRVYALHEGREKDYYFGTFCSAADAEAEVERLRAREMDGCNWAEKYHNNGFVIREFVVETNFSILPLPKPRDKYAVRSARKPNQPGAIDSTVVEVLRRGTSGGHHEKLYEYERNLFLAKTFEPFRQGDKDFALISRDYTRTAVLDLSSGRVIAEEPDAGGAHFCPVGFFVPDWWDVHDGSIIPGSEHWRDDYEWPTGDFGFVWGCVWGDDGSWKVQYLDLSQIQQGVVRREERFGYLELATFGFVSPCLSLDVEPSRNSLPPPFITLTRRAGETQVKFAIEMPFNMESGRPVDWQRLRIADME